jgi:hypothetical protein
MRSTGELLYLLMVIGAFSIFAIVLAWAERTWRPVKPVMGEAPGRALPHAAD